MGAYSLHQRAKPLSPAAVLFGIAARAAGSVVAFHSVVLSGFDRVFGNRADGRFVIFLHEHLFNALRGRAQWLSPIIFYPQKGVLGYSHALLLDLAPYSAFRQAGLDPFLACQMSWVVLSLCGFLATLIVGMRYLWLHPALAICAALLSTFPNNLIFIITADSGQTDT